nr:F-box domain, leucine-rich repeat domain, L domain-like protein [Tanacetum cinerariifolium]
MWRRSGGNVLRTLRLASRISILSFGMIPGTSPELLKIGKTGQRARSYLDRDLGRLLDFEMRWQTSTTQEYPSLIDTFFMAHTVNGEFLRDEDRRIYEEMRRLEAMETYTDDEINRSARRGKQRGHIAIVGSILPARATTSPCTPAHESTLNSLHKKVDFMMSLFKSDSKYSDMFSQFESGGASRSGGCGDEEEGADHHDDEDEDGDGDT